MYVTCKIPFGFRCRNYGINHPIALKTAFKGLLCIPRHASVYGSDSVGFAAKINLRFLIGLAEYVRNGFKLGAV